MNELKFLPRQLFQGNLALLEVDISHNQLRALPEGMLISQMNLTLLDASNNQIEDMQGEIPNDELKRLHKLEHNFTLGSLGNLASLERLALDQNRLTNLDWLEPPGSGGDGCCPNLRELSVARNDIMVIPEALSRFRRLESIHLGHNRIKEVDVQASVSLQGR